LSRTVIKANYVPAGGGMGATLRASAQYYGHRPDAEGSRRYRTGFDGQRDEIGKDEAYRHAERGEGDYAYRIVLSPGEELSGEELKDWTRDVMQGVEEEGGSWLGFVHDDHTVNPHAHVIAFTRERLDRDDFAEMREEGDRSVSLRLEMRAEMQQDPMQEELSARAEQRRGGASRRERDHEGPESGTLSRQEESEMSTSQGE
jgi:hypothetical protein